jgi:hypothetical protein
VPETISLIDLQRAIEYLHRRGPALAALEKCKLRSLELNLRILQDQALAERVKILGEDFNNAAITARARADAAACTGDKIRNSSAVWLRDLRVTVTHSRALLDRMKEPHGDV